MRKFFVREFMRIAAHAGAAGTRHKGRDLLARHAHLRQPTGHLDPIAERFNLVDQDLHGIHVGSGPVAPEQQAGKHGQLGLAHLGIDPQRDRQHRRTSAPCGTRA